MNNVSGLLLISLLLLLPGCLTVAPKKMPTNKLQKKYSVTKPFHIKIDGVECRLCAQEAERLFVHNKDYYGISFIQSMGNYEKGYLRLYLSRGGRNIDVQAIRNELKKKDFTCASIEGQFIGSFQEQEGSRVFITSENETPFLVSDSAGQYTPISDAYWEQLKKNEEQRIHLKVHLDDNGWWVAI